MDISISYRWMELEWDISYWGLKPATMIAEPLTWKHLLQAVLIAATIALIVWYREKMHPWFIVGIGLVTFGSVFATVSETLRLDPVLPWWLEIVPIVVNMVAVAIFALLWYYNENVNREAPS